MFHKKGYIVVEKAKASEDALMAAALDAGADDLRDDGDSWEVVSPPEAFQQVLDAIKALGIEPAAAEIAMLPQNYVKLEGQAGAADGQADGRPRGPRGHEEGLVERRHRGKGDRGLVGVRDLRDRSRLAAHRLRLRRADRQPPRARRLRLALGSAARDIPGQAERDSRRA